MKAWHWLVVLGLVAAVAAGAVWYIAGRGLEIRITEDELREALQSRFPLRQTHYLVLDVTLDQPRIALREDSDRIALGVDARLDLRIGRQREPLLLGLDLETGLRFVPGEGQFYLDRPELTALDLAGLPDDWSERGREVLTAAAGVALTRRPIYTLKSADARQAAAKLVLRDVRVDGSDLVVRLGR